MNEILLRPDFSVSFVGPDLTAGKLPAIFYFSLSAHDSLLLDPFNQPVAYLAGLPVRIFSLTLPGHEEGLPPTQALDFWAQKFAQGEDPLTPFIEKARLAIDALIERGVIDPNRIAVAGLSRGAFLAAHVAAVHPAVRWILGFAPLTKLTLAKEFEAIREHPLANALNLEHITHSLTERSLRFYIGNCDSRVGTKRCFDFIHQLCSAALEKKIRSPQAELFITPSIGHQGHGTSKEIFHQGAQWLAEQMGVIDVL